MTTLSVPGGNRSGSRAAGLLLTGGSSRRMGSEKARLPAVELPGDDSRANPEGESIAERTARLLGSVASPVLEVGPGVSGLSSVLEDPPGSGPLAAVARGCAALGELGWAGEVIVVATDLPRLSEGMLAWLAAHPARRSIVPVAGGRPQPLCARYEWEDVLAAASLVREGEGSMRALLAAADPLLCAEEDWSGPAGDPRCLDDVDTPEEYSLYREESRREEGL